MTILNAPKKAFSGLQESSAAMGGLYRTMSRTKRSGTRLQLVLSLWSNINLQVALLCINQTLRRSGRLLIEMPKFAFETSTRTGKEVNPAKKTCLLPIFKQLLDKVPEVRDRQKLKEQPCRVPEEAGGDQTKSNELQNIFDSLDGDKNEMIDEDEWVDHCMRMVLERVARLLSSS
jgi:hypothetical protein